MTSTSAHLVTTSPNLIRSQNLPASFQHPPEQQMTNDASHHHHVHVPRHQPDVNEYKENNDRLTSTSVFPPSSHLFDDIEHVHNENERKSSLPRTITTTTTTAAAAETVSTCSRENEKLSVTKEMPTSSTLSSNQIITTTAVQSDNNNNDVSSLNHHISSSATITATLSLSSDSSSPTRRFILSSIDQQSNTYGNDESLPTFLPSPTTSSSLLMHEQANHANDKYSENKNPMNKDISTTKNHSQTSTSPPNTTTTDDKSKYSSLVVFFSSREIQTFLLILFY